MTMNWGPVQVTTRGGTSPAHSMLGISQGLVWPSLGLRNVQIQVLKKYFNVSKSQFHCWLCRVTCRQLVLLWERGAALGTQGWGRRGAGGRALQVTHALLRAIRLDHSPMA